MFIKNFIKYDFKMTDNNASYREENSKFTLISDFFYSNGIYIEI